MSGLKDFPKKKLARILKCCTGSAESKPVTTLSENAVAKPTHKGNKSIPLKSTELEILERNQLLEKSDHGWRTTRTGLYYLKRLLSEVDEFQRQHQQPGQKTIVEQGQISHHFVNEAESPLSRLHFRKGANSKPYIDEHCFHAGERLRSDFTRGQLVQQVSSNWSVSAIGGGSSGTFGLAELTDAAMAARMRFEQAIEAVGPELTGVMLDVCCFLKGLERVEKERSWPPRSAKLMLKTGLTILARHYGLEAGGSSTVSVRHWGTDGYHPVGFINQ